MLIVVRTLQGLLVLVGLIFIFIALIDGLSLTTKWVNFPAQSPKTRVVLGVLGVLLLLCAAITYYINGGSVLLGR